MGSRSQVTELPAVMRNPAPGRSAAVDETLRLAVLCPRTRAKNSGSAESPALPPRLAVTRTRLYCWVPQLSCQAPADEFHERLPNSTFPEGLTYTELLSPA